VRERDTWVCSHFCINTQLSFLTLYRYKLQQILYQINHRLNLLSRLVISNDDNFSAIVNAIRKTFSLLNPREISDMN